MQASVVKDDVESDEARMMGPGIDKGLWFL